ncbi:MAG: cytochrome c [Acetobacter okinawensis]|uniref:c-type cytochrome n=1 Tax=Acetobacter okinawensis TaxID=1076594 RepID=UPI0039EAEDF3
MFTNSLLRTSLMACVLGSLSLHHGAWAEPHTHTGNRGNAGQPLSFSAEQVAHGAQIYATTCAACHGPDLAGGHDVPDLGPYFTTRWASTPLDRLASAVSHAAPLMPPQDTAALVAFILHHNGVTSASNAPLPMEEARLANIRFPAPAPPTTSGNPHGR